MFTSLCLPSKMSRTPRPRDIPDPSLIQKGSRQSRKHVLDDGTEAANFNKHGQELTKWARTSSTVDQPDSESGETPPTPTSLSATDPTSNSNNINEHPEAQVATLTHRQSMQYRSPQCAADEKAFSSSQSLAFTFLGIEDQQYDENGTLMQCMITCAFCMAKGHVHSGWKWKKASHGHSTGNYDNHFKAVHSQLWKNALEIDHQERGLQVIVDTTQTTLEMAVSTLGYSRVCGMNGS